MIDVCAFRLDDITPDMDWNRFYRVKAIFDKYKVKPLIGVVPDNHDERLMRGEHYDDFWEYVASLEREGWLLAQHGYRHVYETKSGGMLGLKRASEFAGLPYEVQYEKIKNGQEILLRHGLSVKIFMAPGHTFDKYTLRALRKLGFTCVTDGFTKVPCRRQGLLFVPCRSWAPRLSGGVDTICLHCNELGESDYRELENFLEMHGGQVVPFSEMAGQLWYPRMQPGLFLQERCNLLLHRLRMRIAKSSVIQAYMQETYDEDKARKRKKRIRGLPGLMLGLWGFGARGHRR